MTPFLVYNVNRQTNLIQKETMLMDIIQNLLNYINYLYQMNCWLIMFICKFVPLKQWAYDDSHSQKYQKFKVDKLPVIKPFIHQDWQFLLEYYQWKYHKTLKPVQRRSGKTIPEDTVCPLCGAPHQYIYDNNGGNGQYQCKVCGQTFVTGEQVTSSIRLICPYCGHTLVPKKDRKFFRIHKCVNKKCSYYQHNLKKVDKEHLEEEHGKHRYKLHYIYREFTLDFFKMDLDSLPANASSLKFKKYDSHVMGLCLTLHVNLGLSLRKTSRALKDLYGLNISHQQVANYAKTAAIVIKPFTDHYDYQPGPHLTADETYIKVRGIKGYVWFILDAARRSIIGYQVSDNRSVGPCILAMRMALRHFKEKLPKDFKFIADGYSAYPLAAQQFVHELGEGFQFDITQVIGLTNDDEISAKHRPYKQIVERLNRTFKETYRVKCGFDNYDGASYSLALWVTYYNFLRPHEHNGYKVLNHVDLLDKADNMPGKWQLLIHLGQQTILKLQEEHQNCS